ncbi:MAG TPA: nucleotidyltransferase domain-containing protein [Polyangiaceae bacterium]|nr:nucleotidyltransferase domain-containing protein [Polyangiaceae bacterium]
MSHEPDPAGLPVTVSALVERLTALLLNLPEVRAVAWGGSHASGTADCDSDLDLYVFVDRDIPLRMREVLVAECGGAIRADLGMTHWGPGDMWVHSGTEQVVDLIYFQTGWMTEHVEELLVQHKVRLGYTTCFLHTLQHARVLADPSGWLGTLRDRLSEYPEGLRRNIIMHNHQVLRESLPSFGNQLAKALRRADSVSVNHRLAGLLASYFDILFAFNRQIHPGEKRILHFARERCAKLPLNMEADVKAVLAGAAACDGQLEADVTRLLDRLDALLDVSQVE